LIDFLLRVIKLRKEAEWTDRKEEPSSSQNRSNQPNRGRFGNAASRGMLPHNNNFHAVGQAPTRKAAQSSQRVDKSCIFCGESHASFRCKKPLTYEERCERVEREGACRICLKRGHFAKGCKEGPRKNCGKCNGRHYILMCKKAQLDAGTFHVNEESDRAKQSDFPDGLTRTATVWASGGGERRLIRLFLYPGSVTSYIVSETVKDLGSRPKHPVQTTIKTMGNTGVNTMNTFWHSVLLGRETLCYGTVLHGIVSLIH
jgi:hypothetical protein